MFDMFPGFRLLAMFLLLGELVLVLLYYSYGLFDGYYFISVLQDVKTQSDTSLGGNAVDVWWANLVANLSDVAMEPYVPKILSSIRWWDRLGLHLCKGDSILAINSPVSVESYYRKVVTSEGDRLWHHWLFLSDFNENAEDGTTASAWHDAFSELVQYQYRQPASNGAGFHYVSCSLDPKNCMLWNTTGPALVHLTTENEDGSRKQVEKHGALHENVHIRVIRLPLSSEQMHVAPGLFPSPLNQLKSLTHNQEAWKNYKPSRNKQQFVIWDLRMRHITSNRHPITYGSLLWAVENVIPTVYPPWLFSNPFVKQLPYGVGYATTFVVKGVYTVWIVPAWQKILGAGTSEPSKPNLEDGSAWQLLGARAEELLVCLGEDRSKRLSAIEDAKPMMRNLIVLIQQGREHGNPDSATTGHTTEFEEQAGRGCWKIK